ncbi:MAG: SHOCT domain-containing protein [Actinomycetes bacterium]
MDEPMPGLPEFGALSLFFVLFGVLFFILFLCATGFIVFLWAKTYQGAKKHGVDPLTVPGQIAGRLATSDLLASKQSVEARLSELDDLHARGVISDEEHRAARSRVLGGT